MIIGWGGDDGAENIQYGVSASTTRVIGADVGDAMLNLFNNDGAASRTYCTGHSLGSHVCGAAGKRTRDSSQTLSRITGMNFQEFNLDLFN